MADAPDLSWDQCLGPWPLCSSLKLTMSSFLMENVWVLLAGDRVGPAYHTSPHLCQGNGVGAERLGFAMGVH